MRDYLVHLPQFMQGEFSTHPGFPRVDPTARCKGRFGFHLPDEIMNSKAYLTWNRQWRQFGRGSACLECKISKTRCDKSSTVADDKCRRCLRQNKECVRYSSARPSHVEHSGKGSDHSSEEGVNNINFNSETDPSTAFSMGLTETNACKSVKLVIPLLRWTRLIDWSSFRSIISHLGQAA